MELIQLPIAGWPFSIRVLSGLAIILGVEPNAYGSETDGVKKSLAEMLAAYALVRPLKPLSIYSPYLNKQSRKGPR